LDDRVKAVFEDTRVYALLDESVPKINADQVHSAGSSGAGVKVCIVDTGVEKTHTSLAGKVIAEQCYCAGSEGPIGCCPNGLDTDVSATDDNGHGTHVAGIIAGADNTVGVLGIAPQAWLYAVKVLNRNGSGFVSDIIEGLQWSISNGIQVVLSTYCHFLHDAIKDDPLHQLYRRIVNEENKIMRHLADKNELKLVDNAALVPHDERYFVDSIHFTPEGMRLIASNIADAIRVGLD